MALTIDLCRRLREPAAEPLLEQVAAIDPADVSAIARLRRRFTHEEVAAAIELVDARRRGRSKFGQWADHMLLDRVGVEQASALAVARVKAQALIERFGHHAAVWDLCCGVGGDAIALAEQGFAVTAVDREEIKLFMARHNVQQTTGRDIAAIAGDVEDTDLPPDAAVHLDPDRRAGGRRRFRLADYDPGPAFIETLARRSTPTAVKLAPGIDPGELPEGQVQWLSDAGRLVQAVLWTGPVEPGHRATRIRPADTPLIVPHTDELVGPPATPPLADDVARYVFEADPAAERAELQHVLCERHGLAEAHAGLGLLTGDAAIDSPWLTGFEVLDRMPWREKRVKAALRERNVGIVEVKTRDGAVDPDRVQKAMRGPGEEPFTLFVLRLGRRVEAWITKRIATRRH
ncbi:MAG: THUMP-like domain-containing protein [Phycisphaeraceae bacterium]